MNYLLGGPFRVGPLLMDARESGGKDVGQGREMFRRRRVME